jgi:NAD(P)H-binding
MGAKFKNGFERALAPRSSALLAPPAAQDGRRPHPGLSEQRTYHNQREDTSMPEHDPILITGAAGEIGAVSRTMVEMLLEQGHPLRAFVRRDDERAHSLRQAGAEVFVGDLLNIADVAAALKGCRRIYFSMSLSPYYTDAVA